MNQKVRHCSICNGVLERKPLGPVSGQESPLKLTTSGMPALACPKGHKVPVHRDFLLWLIQEIRGKCEPAIAAGKEEGMLFKKHLCGACSAALGARPDRRESFGFDLAYADTPPFRLEVEMPVYKCGGCGKEQIRSAKELHNNVPAAIASINDAAGFPHSG